MNIKTIVITAIVALVVSLGVVMIASRPAPAIQLGGVTNYDSLETAELAVGSGCSNEGDSCTGTAVTQILTGTCNATGPSAGLSASSTAIYQCAVTNAASGDKVFVSLPGGSNIDINKNVSVSWNTQGGSSVFHNGVAFASTSGAIGFELFSVAATSSFRQATTGVKYWIIR